ncbi:DNA-binding protein [Candidatus Bathyarchaeota archaeon]|nr:MAG: DNA-binding protein [Candidatus Bathyarchaeota archaeon]
MTGGLGENLRRIRQTKQVTQAELARVVGVDPTFISKLELGKRLPSLPILLKLATALNVTIDELLDNNTPAASR